MYRVSSKLTSGQNTRINTLKVLNESVNNIILLFSKVIFFSGLTQKYKEVIKKPWINEMRMGWGSELVVAGVHAAVVTSSVLSHDGALLHWSFKSQVHLQFAYIQRASCLLLS